MEEKSKFFNFPIQLLQGFVENPQKCFENILDYSVYQMVYSEDARYEDLDEFKQEWRIKIPEIRANRIYSNGKVLYDSFAHTNSPWTGIHKKTYFQIRDETDEFKLICFLAFTAFKSLIQKKPWCKVSNKLLLARMAGFSSQGDNQLIPEKISHWMKLKSDRRKRIFEYMEQYNRLVYLPNARGITFSLSCSFKKLVYYSKAKKVANEISKMEKAEHKKQVIQEVEAEFRELLKNRNKN